MNGLTKIQDTGLFDFRTNREVRRFYFHQNGYTANGDKLVFSTRSGLSTYNFKTKKVEQIVEGRAGDVIVGKQSRNVYYMKGDTVYETNVDTKTTREIVKDAKLRGGAGFAINADETLLGGSLTTGETSAEFRPRPPQPAPSPNAAPDPQMQRAGGDNYPGKGDMMERRLAAKIPMALLYGQHQKRRDKNFSPGDRLAQSRSVFADRSDPDDVFARRTVA